MTARENVAWYAPRIFSLCAAIFGVFFFFYYYDLIGRAILNAAKIEQSPWFTGGKAATVIYDPVGDDTGFGALTYPAHEAFAAGSLDLLRYTVHEPIWNAAWMDDPQIWQIDFAFASGPAEARNVRVYIDADGDASGNGATRDELAEGVSLDPSFPWDYCLAVEGLSGTFSSADGTIDEDVGVVAFNGGKDISVRIPLSDRSLASLYVIPETAHYVFVGGWTPWGKDGFVPVARRASSGTGGGAISSFTPKIYDCLVSDGRSQRDDLSAWDEDSLSPPVMHPVKVRMRAAVTATGGLGASLSGAAYGASGERRSALAKLSDEESSAAADAAEKAWETMARDASSIHDIDYAKTAFRAGKVAVAEATLDALLAKNGDDASALAYKGAIVAKRAANASPLLAVEIVADAYRYLDRAVELAKTREETLDARISRASVSMAIPETVFGKAAEGAEDFLAAAKGATDSAMSAEMYFNAARCLEAAGNKGDAGTWYREAARLAKPTAERIAGEGSAGTLDGSVSAGVVLELVKRGFVE